MTSVELDLQHVSFIRQFLKTLGAEDDVTLLRADVLRFLRKATGPYDFIFADPPYALPELTELPDRVLDNGQWAMENGQCASLLASGGLFVLEHGKTQDFTAHPRFVDHRAYGSVNFSIFR